MNALFETQAVRYINRIRNPFKKAYAQAWYEFLKGEGDEPDSSKLSVMGAQAVRIALNEMFGLTPIQMGDGSTIKWD